MSVDAPLAGLVERILAVRRRVSPAHAALVALSGIDGAGKGWLAERLREALERRGLACAVVNVDGWLNLPHVRFGGPDPGAHFYRHALRLEELRDRLVEPLRRARSLELDADLAAETATRFHRHRYSFRELDVILLEGIFLLKRELALRPDLALWLDCSFATALERALARAQEGLSPADTVRAYETIYFPAQRLHLERDRPREAADQIVVNDPRLAAAAKR